MAKKILIVDDVLNVRFMLKILLSCIQGGFKIDESVSFDNALDLLEENNYDLIILDYDLRDKATGWNIAKKIKCCRYKYGNPKVMLMSESMRPEDADLTLAEYDCYVGKPFNILTFSREIERLLDCRVVYRNYLN